MSANSPWKPPAAAGADAVVRRSPAQAAAPKPRGASGPDALGVWALVVSIAAFLLGWLPVIGLIIGVGGVILSVLAKEHSNRRNFGRLGLNLSLWAVVFNIGMIIMVAINLIPPAGNPPG